MVECVERCDKCGRFTATAAPGVSWSRCWWEDGRGGELEDPRFRCHPCTEKHGVRPTNCAPGYPGNGRNPIPMPSKRLRLRQVSPERAHG